MGMPRKQKAILAVIGLAVIGMLVAFGHEPSSLARPDNCPSKGIDPEQRKEGTCEIGHSENVVVDRDHTVKLETLEARIEGMRKGPVPGGSKKRILVTFDLRVTNRTDSPQRVGENQFVLLLGSEHGEDVAAEEELEPDSFLSPGREIPPGGIETGTVTFLVAQGAPKVIAEHGNLDIGNFGSGSDEYEPEGLFDEPEVGVIRTYR
jgi:hypothetical protein